MIDENLVAFLIANTKIFDIVGDNVSVGHSPSDLSGSFAVEKYIWISNFDESQDLDLDGTPSLTRFSFDVECCCIDTDQNFGGFADAKILGHLVKRALNGHMGAFDTVTVDSIIVESKDDEYIPYNRSDEKDISVVALNVTIIADDSVNDLPPTGLDL